MPKFVDRWIFGPTLGEGAYAEVKLLLHKSTGKAVAVKIIDLETKKVASRAVRKESSIHSVLFNPNIIRCFGRRSELNVEYIFLEYASGGELFDRIEPDVGMPAWQAQKYFRQLISGVEYLHNKGIVHRDLKPENLLLDENDNLKISDFGLATIYRYQGKERCLDKKCGTMPYVAPEVLFGHYRAEPTDVWSCGVILVALLAGELPWDQSSEDCGEYRAWKNGKYMSLTPWKKLDTSSLSLIKNVLLHSPSSRYTIKDIKQHRWFIKTFQTVGSIEGHICHDEADSRQMLEDENLTRFCLSQPELPRIENNASEINLEKQPGFSFSQPAHIEDLLVCTHVYSTQETQQNTYQRLVRRMTRFFVTTALEATVERLINCLDNENYTYRINDCRTITINGDSRKRVLVYKANLVEMDGKILVDFRLSKGCGLEFKRRFMKIKAALDDIVLKDPVTWPIAVATKCIP
ncbi:serine/threonine-protein kinase grp isoform X1 [Nomia melanderi]|uniref:serine/threonine-protein kinase grp isoform X1 n=1 Tax=Nomia melanderi TaxID=2448451 RepID=UPI0013040669|nr:serine/threonine-protein kinase grp isoform X1 [Nomia melanderi]